MIIPIYVQHCLPQTKASKHNPQQTAPNYSTEAQKTTISQITKFENSQFKNKFNMNFSRTAS